MEMRETSGPNNATPVRNWDQRVQGKLRPLPMLVRFAGGGVNRTMDSGLTSYQAAPGLILGVPKIFLERLDFLDVVEIYRLQCTAYCVDSGMMLNSYSNPSSIS